MPDDQVRTDVLLRLRNVKGHITGVERMVNEKSPCKDVLLQLSAIRSSVEKIGIYILENYATECLMSNTISPEEKQKIEQIVKDMVTFLK